MGKILIINGPNLNLTGEREPEIYGNESMETWLGKMEKEMGEGVIDYYQSNHEGDIIDRLQSAGDYEGIILNAGGYSHTSIAIADCIRAMKVPVVEVHISNVYAREPFRHVSPVAQACKGIITGLGLEGYALAAKCLLKEI